MRPLTPDGILEKNIPATSGAWLLLADLTIPTYGRLLLAANTSSILWNSETYSAIPMSLSGIQESSKGSISTAQLQIGNADLAYVEYLNSLVSATVVLSLVHSDHLDSPTADLSETFTILEAAADSAWLTLTLGAISPLTRRFPRDRYVATTCRHVYRGPFCHYIGIDPGIETTCDHTLTACGARSNSMFYGGSPGVAEGIYG